MIGIAVRNVRMFAQADVNRIRVHFHSRDLMRGEIPSCLERFEATFPPKATHLADAPYDTRAQASIE